MTRLTDEELVEEIDDKGVGLTPWEIKFLEQMFVVLEEDEVVSLKRRKILEEIYEERVP